MNDIDFMGISFLNEKRYEVIFIQLNLWKCISYLYAHVCNRNHIPIYVDTFFKHNVFQISNTPIF